MKLFVDARPLVDPAQGGVARVARGLVHAYAIAYPEDELICVTTGVKKPILPDGLSDLRNVTHLHRTMPNKLWSALSWLGL